MWSIISQHLCTITVQEIIHHRQIKLTHCCSVPNSSDGLIFVKRRALDGPFLDKNTDFRRAHRRAKFTFLIFLFYLNLPKKSKLSKISFFYIDGPLGHTALESWGWKLLDESRIKLDEKGDFRSSSWDFSASLLLLLALALSKTQEALLGIECPLTRNEPN